MICIGNNSSLFGGKPHSFSGATDQNVCYPHITYDKFNTSINANHYFN